MAKRDMDPKATVDACPLLGWLSRYGVRSGSGLLAGSYPQPRDRLCQSDRLPTLLLADVAMRAVCGVGLGELCT